MASEPMSQSESLKLMNCPFCNGKATWGMEDNSHGFHIRCEDCGVTGPEWGQFDDPEVYAAWNRRPSTADRGGEVASAAFGYEVTGFGGSYSREDDIWRLYSNPGIKEFATVKGYDRSRLDWVIAALRSALATTAGEASIIAELEKTRRIFEDRLEVARRADPADAPFPLVGNAAEDWHAIHAEAYRDVLEMLPASGNGG